MQRINPHKKLFCLKNGVSVPIKFLLDLQAKIIGNNAMVKIMIFIGYLSYYYKIESDRAMIRTPIECDSLGNDHIRELTQYKAGKRTATPTLSIKNNLLTVTATTDSIGIYLKLKDRYKETSKKEVITKIVEEDTLTFWQKFWIKMGALVATLRICVRR